ncbi:hypothetical protein CY34DRAFT_19132 [Suillus luteus UH-Slu-Lm8-n1]|uniref:Helicase C-terminal domain-containing protein n=1 Tax=Suillus luteus UH-Slu-Lm8-n1 TaxID=930992 RepID=A0A0C9ZSQ3_9AGAM|nr:hypothetical protein CY34DRAFT_19132 [Suillus luteus UH-Slu-Lm8-n1]
MAGMLPPGASRRRTVRVQPFLSHSFNVMISDGVSSFTRSSTLTCEEAPASSESIAPSTGTFDEAHRVKNPKLKITLAYNQFTSLRRFGLTATWNMEAWTILDWINPGWLGTSKQWKGYVVKSLTIGQSTSATEEERIKVLTVAITVCHSTVGKWVVLDTLLREWRKDRTNKVLIFTKSIKLLDMLEFHLNTNSYGFLKLDGSTKQSDRMPMIDRFHQDSDIFIFLIYLAGGTDLNLTGANKVVIFDPNWNPAHDLQAMDRAYRFGQTHNVFVYRLLGAGSIEELIYARQLYKQQQMAIGHQASMQTRYFSGVQGDPSRQGEFFGIKNIFKLHEDTLATRWLSRKRLSWSWALAHLSSSKSKKSAKSKADGWVYEADSKSGKEEADLRGLSLFSSL